MKCNLWQKALAFTLFCAFFSFLGEALDDKSVLVGIKTLVSDEHGVLSSWNSSNSDHCSWFGVACDRNSRVVSLNISGGECCGGNDSETFLCRKSLSFPFVRFGIERKCVDYVGKLVGQLSPLIGKLSELRVLALPFNELGGEIPVELWRLEKLEVVDLEGNFFTGKLLNEFGGLRRLRVLNLGFNRLDGEIPISLSKCLELEVLNLAGNKLKGAVPVVFSRFLNLRGLYLGNNELSGTVPASFGSYCGNLEHLDLSGNFLVGRIPSSLGNCRHLRTLLLFSNKLMGVIPRELGQLRRLEILDVSRNYINGVIPPELGKCIQLSVLVVSSLYETWPNKKSTCGKVSIVQSNVANYEYNHFEGSIPVEITTLPKLRVLWAPKAALRGELPNKWGDCDNLEMLNLAGNGLGGEINGVFNRCKKLRYLDVSSNRLSGKLDNNIHLSCMTVFNISQNFMTGPIPRFSYRLCPRVSLLNFDVVQAYDPSSAYVSFFLHKMRIVSNLPISVDNLAMIHNFSSNNFSGSIQWLPVAPERSVKQSDYAFLASGNKLSGDFFGALFRICGKFHGIIADISGNKLSGPIPANIGAMCRSLRFLAASDNQFSGLIPESIGQLKSLISIDISNNRLHGQIPASLFGLKYLKHISLAGNNLTGAIPSSFWRLHSLEMLNVSLNSLSGNVQPNNVDSSWHAAPGSADARSLLTINATFSNASRTLPLNGKVANDSSAHENPFPFYSLSASSPDLPSSSSNVNDLTSSPPESTTANNGLNSIEIASIASAAAILSVLLALVILFFFTRKMIPDARVQVSEPKEIKVFVDIGVPLLYENIVQATGNFNASNCIGNGGFGATYKADVSPGNLVAIKRLAVGRFQGVQQFHAEIKALGRVRHPNLVTLIGYHASETEMFLIYNYLPGGNLEDFIKERSNRAVSWRIIHKIAMDIAQALAYLHDQCAPRVLHRDVKPSNILLDNDLNAYLSDFGLARLLGTSETHATTGVAGTFGYVAPEYALTCRVSEKADVYSYGVVLLELISDKKALDPSFSSHENGFNIVSWACMQLRQGRAKDVFTPVLWQSSPHDDLVDMLHLAVTCTVDSLSTRPTMKQVCQRLKQIRPS